MSEAFGAGFVLPARGKWHARRSEEGRGKTRHTPNSSCRRIHRTPRNPDSQPQDDLTEEIWRDTDGKVDILVSGVARRHAHRLGELLKDRKPRVKIIAVEPVIPPGSFSPLGITEAEAGSAQDPGTSGRVSSRCTQTGCDRRRRHRPRRRGLQMSRRLAREEGMLAASSCGAAPVVAGPSKLRASRRNAASSSSSWLPDLGGATVECRHSSPNDRASADEKPGERPQPAWRSPTAIVEAMVVTGAEAPLELACGASSEGGFSDVSIFYRTRHADPVGDDRKRHVPT